MSTITTLASGQITAVDTLIIELVEADETPAVVIIRWPDKPTVLHPRRFLTWRPPSRNCSRRRMSCLPQSGRSRGCDHPSEPRRYPPGSQTQYGRRHVPRVFRGTPATQSNYSMTSSGWRQRRAPISSSPLP